MAKRVGGIAGVRVPGLRARLIATWERNDAVCHRWNLEGGNPELNAADQCPWCLSLARYRRGDDVTMTGQSIAGVLFDERDSRNVFDDWRRDFQTRFLCTADDLVTVLDDDEAS
ncbi:hypothetical protein [Flexivirga oryzae]|uniref:Uncharacterized protein n=1 Tax=Flexivirga oryzae TaxID=1794944 RepID=A0A839NHI3_9MICO|nr:hypothetical protein [Flexivirga oryzae]MBB2894565.1 hypothetical protein [Flexivirga oryzae]